MGCMPYFVYIVRAFLIIQEVTKIFINIDKHQSKTRQKNANYKT